MRLWINGQEVTDWVGWEKAELQITRDTEALQLVIDFSNIKLLGQGSQIVQQQFSMSTPMRVEVEFAPGAKLQGKVYPHGVYWGRDYVLVSSELDNITEFQRRIEGRLVPDELIAEVRFVVAPKVDKALIIGLVISSFILTYLLIKELFELKRDIAVIAGITGAGIGGPVSGSIAAALIAAARIIYIAALVVAIVGLVGEILKLIDRIEKTKGFRLLEALQYFIGAAGYNTLDAPPWLGQVWIIGEDIAEALELFSLAKTLTNSILFVEGGRVSFIPVQGGSFPANLRRGWEERWRYATDETPRRELITFVRDASDEYTLDVPAAVEIDRPGLRGFKRRDIPLALAAVAGDRPVFGLLRAFLNALSLFSRRIKNVSAQYQQAQNLIITERGHFLPKMVYAENPEDVKEDNAQELLGKVAEAYQGTQIKKVFDEVKVPFSYADYAQLKSARFAGLRRLTWRVSEEWAIIEYEEAASMFLQSNITIV